MASLRPTKSGSWYARVQWYEGKSRKEKYVSLKTTSKVSARERFAEVEKFEDDIKEGIEFSFPWIDDIIRTKVKLLNLQDAKLRKFTLHCTVAVCTMAFSPQNRVRIIFNSELAVNIE